MFKDESLFPKELIEAAKKGNVIVQVDYNDESDPEEKKEIQLISQDVINDILVVRDTGKTNMFCIPEVYRLADELSLHNLSEYLTDKSNWKMYIKFIIDGTKTETYYPAATIKFYGTEKFRQQLIKQYLNKNSKQ